MRNGVLHIGAHNTDWDAIRAEYFSEPIAGKKLAEKWGIPYARLRDRSAKEKWGAQKKALKNKTREKTDQKIIENASEVLAENSALVLRITTKLLRRLESEIDKMPADVGSERHTFFDDHKIVHKLKDFSAVLKDLSGETPKSANDDDDPVTALLRRWDDASGQ